MLATKIIRALALVLLLAATAFSQSDFNGVWKLNQNESDDTKKKIEAAIGKGKRGGLFGGMKQKRVSEALENVQAPESLEINQQGSQITITRAGGRARTFNADGSSQKIQTRKGKSVEMSASQREGQIAIEVRPEGRGGRISETYALAANGRKLNVTIRVEGERLNQPIVIRRVYEAAGN
jgi:hypothetical protein